MSKIYICQLKMDEKQFKAFLEFRENTQTEIDFQPSPYPIFVNLIITKDKVIPSIRNFLYMSQKEYNHRYSNFLNMEIHNYIIQELNSKTPHENFIENLKKQYADNPDIEVLDNGLVLQHLHDPEFEKLKKEHPDELVEWLISND